MKFKRRAPKASQKAVPKGIAWARKSATGLPVALVMDRLKRGWSVDFAVGVPWSEKAVRPDGVYRRKERRPLSGE